MDTTSLLKAIDLHTLAEQAGAKFNGRHSSSCPLHHGNNPNAFHIYYGQDGIMRYHCFTNCPEGENGGNAISFYMRWRQVDFKTAVEELSHMFNVSVPTTRLVNTSLIKPSEIDPAPTAPSDQWRSRAAAFVSYTHDKLWNDQRALCYLMGRGLIEDTIGAFNLGFNPRDISDSAEHWGLDGKPIWLPRGIVIPHKRYIITGSGEGEFPIWFVNIRRLAGSPKYIGPRGGVRGIYHGPIAGHPVLLLAEGEFDTMLAWQSANDLCDAATLGGARHRVDVLDASVLMRYAAIVCAYDLDESGERGAEYLRGAAGARISVVRPGAHDLTDYWKSGGDLRQWIAGRVVEQMEPLIAALDEYQQPELFCKWLAVYQRALDARQIERRNMSTQTDEIKPIQTWAVVELMGHVKTAGQVSEETHFGTVLGRIDIPEVGSSPAHSFFFGGASIFRITPCDEQVAKLVLQQNFQAPIVAYQLPRPKFGQAELLVEVEHEGDAIEDDDPEL